MKFNEILNASNRMFELVGEKDLHFVRDSMQNFTNYVRNIDDREMSIEELKEKIISDLKSMISELSKEKEIYPNKMILQASQRFNSLTEEERRAAYEFVSKDLTEEILGEIEEKDNLPDNQNAADQCYITKLIHDYRKEKGEKNDGGEEFGNIEKYSKNYERYFSIITRGQYKTIINGVGKSLDKMSVLSKNNDSYRDAVYKLGMGDMEYPLEQSATDSISVKDFFEGKSMDNLDDLQLQALSAYWVNRLVKEIDTYKKVFFTVDSLDRWGEIRNGYSNFPINSQDENTIMKKTYCLSIIYSDQTIKDIDENSEGKSKTSQKKPETFEGLDTEDFEKIEAEYYNYFGSDLKDSVNSLKDDLAVQSDIDNSIKNLYTLKDQLIYNLVSDLSKTSINWGIVPENDKPIEKTKFLQLWADIKGLNMPFRLHMPKGRLRDFLKEHNGDTIVPLYNGDGDMYIDGKYISTQMYLPLDERQRECISRKLATDKVNPFYRHLNELATGINNEKTTKNNEFIDLDGQCSEYRLARPYRGGKDCR